MDKHYQTLCTFLCSTERDTPTPICAGVCPHEMNGKTMQQVYQHTVDEKEYFQLLLPVIVTLVVCIVIKQIIMKMKGSTPFLNRKRQQVMLIDKEYTTPNTIRFRFGLPSGNSLGLPVGQFIKVFHPQAVERQENGKWNGRDDAEHTLAEIERKYTPVTSEDDVGYFDCVIKVYRPNEHPRFPDGGKFSQQAEKLQIGDSIMIQGPFGHITYLGNGKFKKYSKEYTTKNVCMVAGGVGITPHLQIIRDVAKKSGDKTDCHIIFANQTKDDIILGPELMGLQPKLNLHFTLDSPPEGWSGGKGFVSADMMKQTFPIEDKDAIYLLCGPPPMMGAMKKNLEGLGVDLKRVWEF